MHEFISSITLKKNDCASCSTRIELVCIKCGNCWDCHWKREQVKSIGFWQQMFNSNQRYHLLSNYLPSHVQSIIKKEKRSSLLTKIPDDKKIVDVFGSEKEPICNYLRCHHKFSLHGSKAHKKICTCRHPQNSIIGIAKRIQAM